MYCALQQVERSHHSRIGFRVRPNAADGLAYRALQGNLACPVAAARKPDVCLPPSIGDVAVGLELLKHPRFEDSVDPEEERIQFLDGKIGCQLASH